MKEVDGDHIQTTADRTFKLKAGALMRCHSTMIPSYEISGDEGMGEVGLLVSGDMAVFLGQSWDPEISVHKTPDPANQTIDVKARARFDNGIIHTSEKVDLPSMSHLDKQSRSWVIERTKERVRVTLRRTGRAMLLDSQSISDGETDVSDGHYVRMLHQRSGRVFVSEVDWWTPVELS